MARNLRRHLEGREWLLLATSVVLAGLIWLFSNLSRLYSGILTVPVQAECSLQGHSNVSSNAPDLSARCRADGYRLLRERSRRSRRPVRVAIDRADLRHDAGDRFYVTGNVMNNYLRPVFGDKVDVEDIITDTLFFLFPPENNKRVPVTFNGDFSYRRQYMASGPLRLEPDSVTVYGEPSRLDLVDHVSVGPLEVDDVHTTQKGVLHVRRVKGVRLSDTDIAYELPVSRFVELRSEMPVTARNVPPGRHLQVFPSRATVILHCTFPMDFPEGRDPFESFPLYIDYDDFASSISGRCVARTGALPRGVLDYRVEPAVFDCIESD